MIKRILIGEHDRVIRTDTYLVRVETHDGRVLEDLEPRKLFPYTLPTRYITLLSSDENEQALINDLNDLDEASREAIELCFEDYYMIPEILEVIHIEDKSSFIWVVRTERGKVDFHIRNRQSDIKDVNGHLFIRDSNDNRYHADLSKLDEKSMRKIAAYI
jgi:hypothetical protein